MRKAIIVPMLIVLGALIGPSVAKAEPLPPPRQMQNLTIPEVAQVASPEDQTVLEEVYVPPPTGGQLLLQAALAQVGVGQDCTDLVQNSLAAIGLTARRDSGGFDYGVRGFVAFGYLIDPSLAQPGDIAFTGPDNGGHVWVILDPATNIGVHGGLNGLNTGVANNGVPIAAHSVIRLA